MSVLSLSLAQASHEHLQGSACLLVCLSVHPSIHPSILLSIYRSIHLLSIACPLRGEMVHGFCWHLRVGKRVENRQ